MKYFFCLAITFAFSHALRSQCTVPSTDGYFVNTTITPTTIIRPTSCPWGYNYNVAFNYNVTFTGVNIPSSLYTLQVEIDCNGQNNGKYGLPLSGGSGSTETTTNPSIPHTGSQDQYGSNPHCVDATLQTLRCNNVYLIIQGPGIPYQRILCSTIGIVGLPVELTGISAENTTAGNLVKWSTQTESRNSHFTLQHSGDGTNWTELATIEGKGTTDKTSDYSFLHAKPESGLNYYSLSQTDLDGTSKHLVIVVVENIPEEDLFTVFPNPASEGNVSVKVSSIKTETLDYRLTDELGRTIGGGNLDDYKTVGTRNVFEQSVTLPEGYRCVYMSVYRNGELIKTGKIISF